MLRKFRRVILLVIAIIAASVVALAAEIPTPDQALDQLKTGNTLFSAGRNTFPRLDQARRDLTSTKGQHPFVTVIACSDSRVPVESIFDQGIGDVFVIRVAGNVCGVDEVGSIEYGVEHLNTPLIVVLGHTNCGAVTAAVTGAELHGSILSLVDKIKPAVEKTKHDHPDLNGPALASEAVKANVWQSIDDLFKTSPAVRERVKDGRVMVVGAVYDIATGRVEWMGTHPGQSKLLAYTGGGR